jgi:hypothetical protein
VRSLPVLRRFLAGFALDCNTDPGCAVPFGSNTTETASLHYRTVTFMVDPHQNNLTTLCFTSHRLFVSLTRQCTQAHRHQYGRKPSEAGPLSCLLPLWHCHRYCCSCSSTLHTKTGALSSARVHAIFPCVHAQSASQQEISKGFRLKTWRPRGHECVQVSMVACTPGLQLLPHIWRCANGCLCHAHAQTHMPQIGSSGCGKCGLFCGL